VTAIYITVVVTWLLISFANTFRSLGEHHNVPHQQYLNSFISVLKIVLIFIAVIVVIAIIVNKDPSTLIAGLGAASAILMLAFQDTIKGLVAGIRLTSNNMLAVGDRITLPSAGIDGIVEEIMLTTVKVRNFDNTIVTVSPQTLVDGSFQNWKGMKENRGRKAVRRLYIDYRSIHVVHADSPKGETGSTVNLTLYRRHMEQWLAQHPSVLKESIIMVHQLDATPTGLPLEFVFWLDMQDVLPYEHTIADIMEYAYAQANEYGLRVFQTLNVER
jgi:miniconductance mechanosensitive channel